MNSLQRSAMTTMIALVCAQSVWASDEKSEDLWSVQPLTAAGIPQVTNSSWPHTDIDRFILATLEASRIQPSPDAPAHTVLNRLHYVLTGLPPTPSETTLLLAAIQVTRPVTGDTKEPSLTGRITLDRAKRPSYDEVLAEKVDELLDSPEFGVRWGRHWLDLVRYADSPGTTDPTPYSESWRYRNYVIDAFRNDKPFDQFVREQIAGDLLPTESPSQRVTNLIATGFISLGHLLGTDRDIEKLTLDRIDEQLDVIGTSLLGIRIGCARCHDHKLNPFPTRDYYAMAGIFRSTQAGPAIRMGPGLRPAGVLPILVGIFPHG
jgi:hypothetical protein